MLRFADYPKRYKATTFISHFIRPDDVILKYLKRQNPSLRTNLWKVIHRQEMDAGLLLVFIIDEESAHNLAKMDYRPFFVSRRIHIKVQGREESIRILPPSNSKTK